jgi:hypothetical protein
VWPGLVVLKKGVIIRVLFGYDGDPGLFEVSVIEEWLRGTWSNCRAKKQWAGVLGLEQISTCYYLINLQYFKRMSICAGPQTFCSEGHPGFMEN